MMGMWSWSMIKVVCGSSIIDAPWTPSPLVSLVSSLHHHPHQFPQLTSLWKFLWTSLLMVKPRSQSLPDTTVITFPIPRLHWVMVNLGTESGKVIIKVARMAWAWAHTGQTLPLEYTLMKLSVFGSRRRGGGVCVYFLKF